MTRLFLPCVLGAFLGISGLFSAPAPQPSPSSPTSPRNDWLSRHESFLADAKARADQIQIVFLGDSITARWTSGAGVHIWQERYAPLGAINLGISSDATQNVLWRLRNGELDSLHPKIVVLLIGTNNLLRADPPTVAYGVWAIVDEIRRTHPETRVLVQGIFPRADRKELSDKIAPVNELLKRLDDGKMVRYIEFGSKFLQPDGSLPKEGFPDGVHPEIPGEFEIWADSIQPTIDEWLKTPPIANVPPPAPPSTPTNQTTATPALRDEWVQMHEKYVVEENKLKPGLLFFGDGILSTFNKADIKPVFDTAYAKYKAFNFSIVGNSPKDLLWELQNGAIDSVAPTLIVVHLQDSLTDTTPVDTLLDDMKTVIQTIQAKLPASKILLLGAFPAAGTPDPKIARYNTGLLALADNKTIWYLDAGEAINKSSAISGYPTYHRPNREAYENWLKVQDPTIEQLMKP